MPDLKRSLGVAATVVMLALPTAAFGQDDPVEPGSGGETCFHCAFPGMNCTPTQHSDFQFFGNYLKGEMHQCQPGDCDEYFASGHHRAYSTAGTLPEALTAVSAAIEDGGDAALIKVLQERKEIQLNSVRSAVQLVTATGQVLFHAPVDRAQTERISVALAEAPSMQ